MMRGASVVALLVTGACGGDHEGPQLPIRTVPLPAPELVEPAFEPSIAIDPDNPDRIIIGAQYGIGYNRGGRKIWIWQSEDAGKTWTGANVPLPGPDATLAADAVAAFGTDGIPILGFLFADQKFRGGLAVARGRKDAVGFGPAAVIAANGIEEGRGAVDKPWIAVDRSLTSPLRGTIYLTWHLNRPMPDKTVESTLWISSTNDGREWREPLLLAEQFGGQVGVRPDGTVDVVFLERNSRTLYHRSSSDGGRSFSPPDTVANTRAPFELDLASVVGTRDNRLALCWPIDSAAMMRSRNVRCTAGSEAAGWMSAIPLEPTRVTALPAIAADANGVWVLAYRTDSTSTEVVLYRSIDGGTNYRQHSVLATRPFGIDYACLAPGGPCRKAIAEGRMFFPGDYVGLALAPDRIVAAFVLPEGDAPDGRPTVYASIINP